MTGTIKPYKKRSDSDHTQREGCQKPQKVEIGKTRNVVELLFLELGLPINKLVQHHFSDQPDARTRKKKGAGYGALT